MLTNATIQQLNEALNTINADYSGNISFKDIAKISKNRVRFTIKAVSKKPGARVSHTGRNIPAASWHVHGQFFDKLFAIDSNIYILSMGKRIDINGGNWEDRNIGSMAQPMLYSESSILK